MKRLVILAGIAATYLLGSMLMSEARTWDVVSPDHPQTFAYGSERWRHWTISGQHLGLALEFTNDPYVTSAEPRQYDDFLVDFPEIKLGKDGKTFFYRTGDGKEFAVAEKRRGFLFDTVALLPSSALLVEKEHGLLTLDLVVNSQVG